ncbi:hypothetical protein FWH13_00135 [Candidatus Saccharibacteria bacterium]|nr:hypothetical protein [Candidatus Saccharibacteria bacterium]
MPRISKPHLITALVLALLVAIIIVPFLLFSNNRTPQEEPLPPAGKNAPTPRDIMSQVINDLRDTLVAASPNPNDPRTAVSDPLLGAPFYQVPGFDFYVAANVGQHINFGWPTEADRLTTNDRILTVFQSFQFEEQFPDTPSATGATYYVGQGVLCAVAAPARQSSGAINYAGVVGCSVYSDYFNFAEAVQPFFDLIPKTSDILAFQNLTFHTDADERQSATLMVDNLTTGELGLIDLRLGSDNIWRLRDQTPRP